MILEEVVGFSLAGTVLAAIIRPAKSNSIH
jgi:hypothetical protein